MTPNKQAGRMILEDLQLFNQAVVLFESEIQPTILENLLEVIKAWSDARGWTTAVDAELIDDHWIAPKDWAITNAKEQDDSSRWFYFASAIENDDYDLANLCGLGATTGISLWFVADQKLLGFKGKAWKTALQSVIQQYMVRLKPLGFIFDESELHIPLKLDAAKLAAAWDNDDYDEFLEPLITVLNFAEQAVPILNEMVAEMQRTLA